MNEWVMVGGGIAALVVTIYVSRKVEKFFRRDADATKND